MYKAVAAKASEPTCSMRRHGLPILAETAGLKGIKPHVQRPTIQHSPPPTSQLFTFYLFTSLLPSLIMSGRGRRYDEDDERWDETDTAQRRRQFFEGQQPSTALTRGPSTRSRPRDPNEPYTEPSTGRDDRRRSGQSGNTGPAVAGSSNQQRSGSWERPDYGRNTVPSTYQDVTQERRRRASPTKSMVTQPGESARRRSNRSLSRNRYDADEYDETHDGTVRRNRELAARRKRDTERETQERRDREAYEADRYSRSDRYGGRDTTRRSDYDDDRDQSRDRRRNQEIIRDPKRTTRMSSEERRNRTVCFDPVEDVRHISDDSGTDHSKKEDKPRKRTR